MPCRTYESDDEIRHKKGIEKENRRAPLREEIFVLKEDLRERDAMLCAMLSSIFYLDGYLDAPIQMDGKSRNFSETVREYFNEDDAGVTWEQVQTWWTAHQEQDRVRRAQEALAREARKAEILAKLTPEEREILGL